MKLFSKKNKRGIYSCVQDARKIGGIICEKSKGLKKII